MDLTNNAGIIVVSLDGCLPSSGGDTTNSNLKTDCIYTIAMMGQDEVMVPSATSCFQQSMMDTSVNVIEISQPQEELPPTAALISEQEEDKNYYSLILNYLSTHTFPDDIDKARRIMITRRSRHYCVIDGQLYYGQKYPKKAVCDASTRKNLLKDSHIMNDTGVHVGVQKMYLQLKKDYFWCGMYMDITSFVRDCKLCVDADLPVSAVKTLANKRKGSLLKRAKKITRRSASIACNANQFKDKNEVWKKIELRLSGPYSENKYLLTIADPCSKWVVGKVAHEEGLASQSADFLANTMCHVGFTEVTTTGFTQEQFDVLHRDFISQFNHITSNNIIKESMNKRLTSISNDTMLCPWISELLKSLMDQYPDTWEKELQKFLFDFRNKSSISSQSPFDIMYKRRSIAVMQEQNKENLPNRFSRRLINSSNKQSKDRQPMNRQIVTRALKRQKLSHEEADSVKADTSLSEDEDDPEPVSEVAVTQNNSVVEEVRASTVAAVQAFLSATREERSKRGRYQRYSIELREEIADYALKHGSLEAVKTFSEKLNVQLSESTVRNFAKTYQDFSPTLQEQIGLYATTHTITATTEHFVSLGYQLRPTIVRKFKKRYMEKYPPEKLDGDTCSNSNKKTIQLDENLKEEIGEYASKFGVAATVDYYSNKLETPLKEVTVKKLKKNYIEKLKCQNEGNSETQTETLQNETMEVVQTSFNVLNSSPPTQTILYNQQTYQSLISHPISFHPNQNNIDQTYQQTLPQVLSHNSQLVFSQTPFQTHSTYTNNFNQLHTSNIPATNIQLGSTPETTQILSTDHSTQCNNPQMIISQHPILITHSDSQGETNMTVHLDNLSTLPGFESQLSQQHNSSGTINFLQPSTVTYGPSTSGLTETTEVNTSSNFNPVDIITDNSDGQMIRVIQLAPNIACSENKSSEVTETLLPATSSSMLVTQDSAPKKVKSKKVKQKNKQCQKNGKGRNKYVTYSPEIRAEIGSYAASHGNQQAINHFRDILGKDLPESTVRGLKEKYLAKMEQNSSVSNTKTIKSLGFAPRGRPMRLGKYDDIIRQCIRDLVSNGERVSSFLAITTAKQVLTEHEPQLLAENGGNIQLTTNWAKSFLKRIGIHNNS